MVELALFSGLDTNGKEVRRQLQRGLQPQYKKHLVMKFGRIISSQKTTQDMMDDCFRFEGTVVLPIRTRNAKPGDGRNGDSKKKCSNCGKKGHTTKECWSKKPGGEDSISLGQRGVRRRDEEKK
jgi:hypothetical protein